MDANDAGNFVLIIAALSTAICSVIASVGTILITMRNNRLAGTAATEATAATGAARKASMAAAAAVAGNVVAAAAAEATAKVTNEKLDAIHDLTNSNLAAIKAQLAGALRHVEALQQRVVAAESRPPDQQGGG